MSDKPIKYLVTVQANDGRWCGVEVLPDDTIALRGDLSPNEALSILLSTNPTSVKL